MHLAIVCSTCIKKRERERGDSWVEIEQPQTTAWSIKPLIYGCRLAYVDAPMPETKTDYNVRFLSL